MNKKKSVTRSSIIFQKRSSNTLSSQKCITPAVELQLIPQEVTAADVTVHVYYQQIVEICKKPQLFRQVYENKLLIDSLKQIKFFQDQFDEHYVSMLEDVVENAKLQMFHKGEYIIKQDSYGDLFYILIKGQAKVWKKIITHLGQQESNQKKKNKRFSDLVHEQTKEIMTLNEGDYFGELALLERKPRGADVICSTDCYTLTLDRDSFDRIMATKTKRQFLHLLTSLSTNSIMREISKNTVKALFMLMERRQYNFGDILYTYRDKGNCVYFVIEGEFKMYSEVEVKLKQEDELEDITIRKQMEICVVGMNETLGLEEFLDELPRKWKAECVSQEAVVYKLDRVDYKRIEQRYPDVVEAIKRITENKKHYYQKWKQQHTLPASTKSQIEPTVASKFDFQSYQSTAKERKLIIMKDNEMSFISRDQVTMNDDQDVQLKYSRGFQIGVKPATPFQINTMEQILGNRVQSAGYRQSISKSVVDQYKRPQTAMDIEYENTTIKKKPQLIDTATTQQILTTQSPYGQDDKHWFRTQTPSTKAQSTKRFKSYNDIVQAKMSAFMQLNPEKIEHMAIQQRQKKEEHITKKLYIKQYPIRTVDEMVKRMQSAVKMSNSGKHSHRESSAIVRNKGKINKQLTSTSRGFGGLIQSMHTVQLYEGPRLHTKKNTPPVEPTSQLPLKYQIDIVNKQPARKIGIVSPISTIMKMMKNYSSNNY